MINVERNHGVDAARGFAIVLMAFANMAPYLLGEPPPGIFRVLSTVPAPLFVVLSAMMLARKADAPPKYFLERALYLLVTAGLIDFFINHLQPYRSFDVLYLLGVSTALLTVVRRLPYRGRWILLAAIFAAAPLLRLWLGYTEVPLDRDLHGALLEAAAHPSSIVHHWLLDGWFPLFPWFGLFLFGYQLETVFRRYSSERVVKTAVATALVGAAVWALLPGATYLRLGYMEMFYPPTVGFTICAMGVTAFLIAWFTTRAPKGSGFLAVFGRSSLLLYAGHLALIKYVLFPTFGAQGATGYCLVYCALFALLTGLAFALRRLKQANFPRPKPLRFLLGG